MNAGLKMASTARFLAKTAISRASCRTNSLVCGGNLPVMVRAIAFSTAVPPNLKLSDASLLSTPLEEVVEQKKKQLFGQNQYEFPLLPSEVPRTIAVVPFGGSLNGDAPAEVALNPKLFALPLRRDIVLNVVRYIRHARRQPKKTKRMSEIRGSNKKPRPQKGQGTGQVGHRRNSAWRGGQKAHGPVLRDYSIDLNKKVRALGTMMTVVAKFREGNLLVVDGFEIQTHKTKDLMNLFLSKDIRIEEVSSRQRFGTTQIDKSQPATTAMVVDLQFSQNFERASKNIERVTALTIPKFNAYDLLRHEKLVISARAFEELQDQLWYQYTQSGRRKIQQRASQLYHAAVAEGRRLLSKQ